MTDLSHFFNFNRPPNGSPYNGQQGLAAAHQQQQEQQQQQQQQPQKTFDINEFPSLSKMSLLSQMQASSRANYVNVAKDTTNTTITNISPANQQQQHQQQQLQQQQQQQQHQQNIPSSATLTASPFNPSSVDSTQNFTISSEDFPALPGSNNNNKAGPIASNSNAPTTAPATPPTTSSTTSSSLSSSITPAVATLGTPSEHIINNGPMLNLLQDGTTAAIDQCGRDTNSYFSPIGSQKPMWMNGGVVVDRTTLLSFPTDQCTKSIDNDQVRLSDYSGHGNDFYKLTGQGTGTTVLNGNDPLLSPSTTNNNTSASSNSKKSVQISNDGRVTNIPSSMVNDQFGMVGLLAFLRAAETDPNLASVTFGTDLTALGLNLTAQDKLYPSFAGPWSDQPLKVYEIDYPAPPEYLVSSTIGDKLSQITLKRYHEDTIFFLFYMFPNDVLQMAAAAELYQREWRYHKEERVWLTRAPGIPSEKTQTYERGTYLIFDPHNWRRVQREFLLEYAHIENKPFTN